VVDTVNLPHHHVHNHDHPPVPVLVLVHMNGRWAGRKYANVAVWISSMAGQHTVNVDTVGGLADYKIKKNTCRPMVSPLVQWYAHISSIQILRRLTHIVVIIHFVPPSVRVVQSTARRMLSQIVRSYVRDDDNQHNGEDQGGPLYSIELETPVLLNSLAHTSPDKKTGSYMFKKNQPAKMKQNLTNVKTIEETLKVSRSTDGVGIDQGAFSVLSSWGLE
jgi:hypothetical protein